MTLALYQVILAGGLGQGGLNFDAKLRRQSIDPADLVHAHVGGIDLCARAFLSAAALFEDGRLKTRRDERYAGWDTPDARAMLAGDVPLEAIAARAEADNLDPQPRSGRQEQLENLVGRFT